MKQLEYNLEEIRVQKTTDENLGNNPQYFLRRHKQFIPFLKNLFGDLEQKELCYLINYEKGKCLLCGSDTAFINHREGYKQTCNQCRPIVAGQTLKRRYEKQKYSRKGFCKRCGVDSLNDANCQNCKDKIKCQHCKTYFHQIEKSINITIANVCKKCELNFFLKSKLKKFSSVNCYQNKWCKYCNEIFKSNTTLSDFCNKHRKLCQWCGGRYNKQGVTCSQECADKLTKKTKLQKYGVENNLQLRGQKKSHKEYWLNVGLSEAESIFKQYEFQSKFTRKYDTLGDIYDIFKEEHYILETYTIDIFKSIVLSNQTFQSEILDLYVKENNITSKNKRVYSKFNVFSLMYYVDTVDGVICFRSSLEFYFFTLLEKYGIMFETNKRYGDSEMYYDFYLLEYDIYIEIAGLQGDEDYDNKMNYKQKNFGSIILESKTEMKNYIEQLIGVQNEVK